VATTLVAPLAFAAPSGGHTFPKLLDATASELAAGLDKGMFSSVDLVKVSRAELIQP
jgi:amidase